MQLKFDLRKAEGYKSKSQIARVLTESWVQSNIFCPNCGHSPLGDFKNNHPVADFFCDKCQEQFELKSKKGGIGRKINDGAYRAIIQRITSDKNPSFFLLGYNLQTFHVKNFLIIPKHFFTPKIIEKRKPLSSNAKRAGWQGCNIILDSIPESGKIFYVKNGDISNKDAVLKKWQKMVFLNGTTQSSKGWLLDILTCLEKIPHEEFSLKDIYAFEPHLSRLHPENNFVRDKIRQQLQVLRDEGIIKFLSRGRYVKLR